MFDLTLNNGAKVLAFKAIGDQGDAIVLCKWGEEFVVWRANKKGEAYWGSYFPIRAFAKDEALFKEGLDQSALERAAYHDAWKEFCNR